MRGSISVNFHWIISMKIKIQVMHRDQYSQAKDLRIGRAIGHAR